MALNSNNFCCVNGILLISARYAWAHGCICELAGVLLHVTLILLREDYVLISQMLVKFFVVVVCFLILICSQTQSGSGPD